MYQRKDLKQKLTLADYQNADLTNNVLVRCCLNVPLRNGQIQDDTRIKEALPLLQELKEKSKRVVIMAHLGRPEGRDMEFSLEPVAERLEKELDTKVTLLSDLDEEAEEGMYLLENIRFFPEESVNDLDERRAFAQELAKFGDIFINDAFPDYRESASTYDIVKFLPSFLGPAFLKEIKAFANYSQPHKPLVTILGGAKLSEKLDALNSLAKISDRVLVGGAMAYTLLKAKGIEIGKSLCEVDKLVVAEEIIDKYSDKIVLPIDHVLVDEFKEPENTEMYSVVRHQEIPEDKIAVDIGPQTVELFIREINNAGSLIWNGPMGVFEWDLIGNETKNIATAIAESQAFTLAGGGDSIAAINKYNLTGFDHISTGGGAMLAYFSYDTFSTLDIILDSLR